jgi:hypothetical protein
VIPPSRLTVRMTSSRELSWQCTQTSLDNTTGCWSCWCFCSFHMLLSVFVIPWWLCLPSDAW